MDFWGDSGGFLDEDEGGFGETAENESTTQWDAGRDGLIFLVDATKAMFIKDEVSGETHFQFCMKCIQNTLMSKIISSDKDLIAVVFFGTDKHKNSNDFSNVYTLQDLDQPSAERILQVENLMEAETLSSFGNEYGHNSTFCLSDALWACSNMFANSTIKLSQKRVLLFTNTDDPHADNRENKKRALKKAKDLSDLGIYVDLMHLKQPGRGFDVLKFYRDIVTLGEDGDMETLADPSEKFEELLTRVRRKENKKRALTRLPFFLKDDLKFSVGIYALCRKANNPPYVIVDSRTNEEVKCRTKYICNDTGQELLPTDMKFYQSFGGAKVVFEKEERDAIRSILPQGLHLLGFKPISYMKTHYYTRGAHFIYPDETVVAGSTPLFTALLQRCLARKVTPICSVVHRNGAAPRLATLLPQKEEFDDQNVQIKPPGFHVIYLPFSDDIRKLKIDSNPKASDEQIDKAKEIIDKMKFKFSSEMFENPGLQKFIRGMEAFALDRDEAEEHKDLTLPNVEAIDRKAGQVIGEFMEMIFPADYNASGGQKRKAPSNTAASKKPKPEMIDVDVGEIAKQGRLSKLTVPNLKAFCQANKIKAESQKKGDLIAAINNHFGVD